MEWILSWVKSGLLFGVASSVILMLGPNKAYTRHISLVVGMLFLLVMLHPIMVFLQVDEQTYLSYLEDYLAVCTPDGQTETNLELYETTLALQVKTVLCEAGYSVSDIEVFVNEDGTVREVRLALSDETGDLDTIETYLKQVFGQEVGIRYEAGGF